MSTPEKWIGLKFRAPMAWRKSGRIYVVESEPMQDVFGKWFVWAIVTKHNKRQRPEPCHLESLPSYADLVEKQADLEST